MFLASGLAKPWLPVYCFVVLSILGTSTRASAFQGFGATTLGGFQGEVVHVTNLNDSGLGSLRDALSQGNRYIVFDVAGEISLNSRLFVQGANITIDGFTAPSPGITLKNFSLRIRGDKGAHDVIVQGIRVRITSEDPGVEDGITIRAGAHNVVIDHVSISGASDESIGIVDDTTRDITVSWSILADPIASHNTNMLISFKARRISLHHNLFIQAERRNPWIAYEEGLIAPEIQADVRNNLMWDVSGTGTDHGTVVFFGGKANVVNNYYQAIPTTNPDVQKRVIVVCKDNNAPEDEPFCRNRGPAGGVYVAGNISQDGWTDHINTKGTEENAFPAPFVATTDACTAAEDVLADAGVRPLDARDAQHVDAISLMPCDGGMPQPELEVVPDQLSFTAVVGGQNPAPQTLMVSELTRESLPWTATITEGGGRLSVNPESGTTPSQVTVRVDVSGLSEGSFAGTVLIDAADATNSPIAVPVTLTVDPPIMGEQTVEVQIAAGNDDAEEVKKKRVRSAETELHPGKKRLLAFRFSSVPIPPQAIITSAVLQLYAVANVERSIAIRYVGERSGDSAPFARSKRELTNRPKTAAFVDDAPSPWATQAFNGSPDIRAIIQEIVDQADWASGNSLTLFLANTGSDSTRTLSSFEASPNEAAVLVVMYQLP